MSSIYSQTLVFSLLTANFQGTTTSYFSSHLSFGQAVASLHRKNNQSIFHAICFAICNFKTNKCASRACQSDIIDIVPFQHQNLAWYILMNIESVSEQTLKQCALVIYKYKPYIVQSAQGQQHHHPMIRLLFLILAPQIRLLRHCTISPCCFATCYAGFILV